MIDEILAPLADNEKFGAPHIYTIEGITRILEALDNPHRRYACIHLAGTNGKGSTAHMTDAIFSAAGIATGLYTSPHLLSVCERVRIGGVPVAESDIAHCLERTARAAVDAGVASPTYFDILTASAFLCFAEKGVSLAVLETGLGGRLDSTNVVDPLCSVITDISLDHSRVLGGTLPEIAAEKAGIAKRGVPLLTSNDDPDVLAVIGKAAERNGCEYLVLGKDFHCRDVRAGESSLIFDYELGAGRDVTLPALEVPSPLPCQAKNGALAVTAAIIAGNVFPVTVKHIRNGIAGARIPGRFETLAEHSSVIFDPAHNPAALSVVFSAMEKRFPGRRVTVALSLMADKEIDSIIRLLVARDFEYLYHVLNDPRCHRPSPGNPPWQAVIENEEDLFTSLLDRVRTGAAVLFTGSFRLYGTAQRFVSYLEGRLNGPISDCKKIPGSHDEIADV